MTTKEAVVTLQQRHDLLNKDFDDLLIDRDRMKSAKEALEKEKAQLSSEIQKLRVALAETVKEKFGLR